MKDKKLMRTMYDLTDNAFSRPFPDPASYGAVIVDVMWGFSEVQVTYLIDAD